MADDGAIHERINDLVAEEHRLRSGEATPETRQRLEALERQLDQAWDLLRRRDAAREFGQDPASAQEQPESRVEGYLQ